ncbi:Hypothetical_protein [Hexamita inflata]|uniref:Hypothetical_protein n=1 Tax=Hexamita inflata TaxID=28002 RepID=A0AA86Q8Z2_9EUKA|nr:Hypothetical protein HINF_LOCUS36037 [Hexamita inflata]
MQMIIMMKNQPRFVKQQIQQIKNIKQPLHRELSERETKDVKKEESDIIQLYLLPSSPHVFLLTPSFSFKQKGYVYTAIPSETEPVVETEEIKTDFLNEFQEAPKTKENDKKKKKQKSKEIDEMLPTIPAPKKK